MASRTRCSVIAIHWIAIQIRVRTQTVVHHLVILTVLSPNWRRRSWTGRHSRPRLLWWPGRRHARSGTAGSPSAAISSALVARTASRTLGYSWSSLSWHIVCSGGQDGVTHAREQLVLPQLASRLLWWPGRRHARSGTAGSPSAAISSALVARTASCTLGYSW